MSQRLAGEKGAQPPGTISPSTFLDKWSSRANKCARSWILRSHFIVISLFITTRATLPFFFFRKTERERLPFPENLVYIHIHFFMMILSKVYSRDIYISPQSPFWIYVYTCVCERIIFLSEFSFFTRASAHFRERNLADKSDAGDMDISSVENIWYAVVRKRTLGYGNVQRDSHS